MCQRERHGEDGEVEGRIDGWTSSGVVGERGGGGEEGRGGGVTLY